MLENFQHISFDLDGTLVHTLPSYRKKVISTVVKKLGGSFKDQHSVDRFWFEADRNTIIKNEFSIEPEKFWDLFAKTDLPKQRYLHTQAYPDAEKAIRKLKGMGKTISVITGAPRWVAQMELQRLNGAPIDYYLSLDKKLPEKPDPKGMSLVLKKLKMDRKSTIYIGNSTEDALFAKNAGVEFIYLERKEHNFFLKKESTAVIHSLDDLF